MSMNKSQKILASCFLGFGLLASTVCNAWHRQGSWPDRIFGRHHGYYHNHHSFRPFQGFSFGNGWSNPEVIIRLPQQNYYVPECQRYRVCNAYGECWIERYCD